VENYLAGRGIVLPTPPSLRWAAHCWHDASRTFLPAMVGAVRDVDGELLGVHRTYLMRDRGQWHRRERASLGLIGGRAVQLGHAAEMLMVAEGIETCLAAMQASSMPGWAALSTSGLVALVLPAIVRTVIILADHDCSGAGERAARSAAQRWLGEGRRVRIAMPPKPGTDFADVLFGPIQARMTAAVDAT
jgi:putative DNA primase/helicase